MQAELSSSPLSSYRPTRLALIQTGSYYLAFIALGCSAVVLGPALDNLAAHTGSALSAVSGVFIANPLGRIVGALSSGRIYDKLRGHPIVAIAMLLVALAHLVLPAIAALWVLFAVAFGLGIAEATIDVGCNTLLMRAHGKNVAPYMNGLHLTFGVGALIIPLVVAASSDQTGDVFWAFWFISIVLAPLALWFYRLPDPIPHTEHQAAAKASSAQTGLVMLFVVFFILFVGVEAAPGSWAFNYGKALGLDEIGAGALTSTFFCGFTVGRLVAIPIATRLKPSIMLLLDIIGLFVGIGLLLMVNGQGPSWPMWLGLGMLGFAVASMFATALAWAEQRFVVTGTITGIFLAASNAGAMFFPWIVGQFFESQGPGVMTTILLVAIVGTAVVFAILSRVMRRQG
jgi:fucose permease